MPLAEPTVLDLRKYSLRHIGPKATIYPNTIGSSFSLLSRSDLVARPLPDANIPNSPDFVQGAWTGRLFDAGDGNLIFPNKEASDGQPWRHRFDPTGKLQWLEVWLEEYLESVLCITKATPDRNQVLVEGFDGFQLTKTTYERDWTCIQAPRDVIERGTQLSMATTADNFPAGALNAQWSNASHGGGTVSTANGGLSLVTNLVAAVAQVNSAVVPVSATGAWRSMFTVLAPNLATTANGVTLQVIESGVSQGYMVQLFGGRATLSSIGAAGQVAQVQLPAGPSYTLMLESDGEWITGFVNGLMVGMMRRTQTATTTLETIIQSSQNLAGVCTVTGRSVLTETLQPFLMRTGTSTDLGDYVLPGSAATYPSGGLHARYFGDADIISDTNRLVKIMAPARTQAYAGSGASEYVNQQDVTINGQQNPTPGAALSNWSVQWFGSVYLKLSAGNYTFSITLPAHANNCAVRVWIGKTRFGDQILDQWAFTNTSGQVFSFTLTASTLAGTLSYGGGTVQRDGWYPIKIEYAVDSTVSAAPVFRITSSPTAYTDPGGTAIASGAQSTVVPTTSLSPLGIVDQRNQAVSHFDLVQKTAVAFGYQFSVEPQQLESGSFPGILAPRLQEGTNYATIIEPDDTQRREGMINYSAAVDGTDQIGSLFGNGAGFQNGNSGQLQGYIFDAHTLSASLFNMQGWQDAADAAFASLLGQILGSELNLRLTPWSLIQGDPIAREHQEYLWPLTGVVGQQRWRPGDGARVWARDINVQDTTPRQMLIVTRNIHPNGTLSTQSSFAARPKSGVYANRKALSAALRPQRNYQRALVLLPGTYMQGVTIPAGQDSGQFSVVALQAGDQIVRARLRVNENPSKLSFNVLINGVDQTTALNGPWSTVPIHLDLGPVAVSSNINCIHCQLHNSGGSRGMFTWQLYVEVLR